MLDGILIVNKEKGFTSFDVSHIVKKILGEKTGHTGTLDPDATGVLPVCIGKATKSVDDLMTSQKEYEVTFAFGAMTDTQDVSGKVIQSFLDRPTIKAIEETILSFLGKSIQIPPMYSAIKIDGVKLYDLARQGIEVERVGREIEIFSIDIQNITQDTATMVVRCSKGTYIRTLCHDIGLRLNNGAYMTQLNRSETGGFKQCESYTLDEIRLAAKENRLSQLIIPIKRIYDDYRKVVVKNDNEKQIVNGCKVPVEWLLEFETFEDSEKVSLYIEDNRWLGIYKFDSLTQLFRVDKFYYEVECQ